MKFLHAQLVAAALLSACQSAAPRPQDEAARLLAADRAFAAQALQTGAADAFYRFLTEDALQLPAGRAPVQGRSDIREAMSEDPPMVLAWQPQYAEVSDDASLGWTWGNWQAFEPGAGGKRLAQGKYVNVWRRQADGGWRVRMDMGNAAPQ